MIRFLCATALILSFTLPALAADSDEQSKAAAFIRDIQAKIKDGKREELAGLMAYPLDVNGKPKVKNTAAFLKEYDVIINKNVKECVQEHDFSAEVFARNGQYMIGWGCIWFSPDEKDRIGIDAVNNGPKP